MRYPLGQPITLPITTTDRNGVLGDAGTVTLVVKKPDATTQTYASPAHDSTGKYHQDIPASDLTQLGHYTWAVTTTGTNAGVTPPGEFDVYDPFEPRVLSLQDAKEIANIAGATTIYDEELEVWVDTITVALEVLTGGPAYNRTVTERAEVTGDWRYIALRQRPVVSVTSIVNEASGATVLTSDVVVDTNSGLVERKLGLPFYGQWGRWFNVTYVAGWGTQIPASFNAAARLIIDHLASTMRGPGQSPVPRQDETFLPGVQYAIPNRAIEVMRPYTLEVWF